MNDLPLWCCGGFVLAYVAWWVLMLMMAERAPDDYSDWRDT